MKLSMTKIAVAPESTIACDLSIPIFGFRCTGIVCVVVVVAIVTCWGMVCCSCVRYVVVLDIITVLSSSSLSSLVTTSRSSTTKLSGSREIYDTWLHLCAILISAPHRHMVGNWFLCAPFIDGWWPIA